MVTRKAALAWEAAAASSESSLVITFLYISCRDYAESFQGLQADSHVVLLQRSNHFTCLISFLYTQIAETEESKTKLKR